MAKGTMRSLVGVGTLLGSIILGAAVVQTDVKGLDYVPPLDPRRVDCTAFNTGSYRSCYKTANDFYQLNELILDQLEAGNFAEAIQETLPTTPQMFPDGRIVYGVDGATAIVSTVFGSNDFSFGPISNNFRYRPLDHKTVVAFGVITWTIIDHEHGTIRTLETAQTELFRRNKHRPRGWEQIYEQFAYVTPLLGEQ
ncbi:MAG: hypothetical protein L0387_18590 [Acidobacteria bacterium]|nr:hypothetical protein [Acidobacteriota bacterium]